MTDIGSSAPETQTAGVEGTLNAVAGGAGAAVEELVTAAEDLYGGVFDGVRPAVGAAFQ